MMRVNAKSVRDAVRGIRKAAAQLGAAAQRGTKAAGDDWKDTVRKNMSLQDHPPSALADQGHPYARRQGSIGIHRSGSQDLKHPQLRIHTQTGTLLNALKSTWTPQRLRYRVELDAGIAPHAPFVIKGTRVMLGRDVIADTALAPVVRKRMVAAVATDMIRAVKAVRPVGGG